jgi:hypothetical protein
MSQTGSLAAILAADVAGHDLLLATTPVDERDGPPFRNAYCARGARLSLPRKLKGPIMASTPSGIWGMSAHSAPTIEQD